MRSRNINNKTANAAKRPPMIGTSGSDREEDEEETLGVWVLTPCRFISHVREDHDFWSTTRSMTHYW